MNRTIRVASIIALFATVVAAQTRPAETQAAGSKDKPLRGIEGVLEGFPRANLPGVGAINNDVRLQALNQWLASNVVGKRAVLTGGINCRAEEGSVVVTVGNSLANDQAKLPAFPPRFGASAKFKPQLAEQFARVKPGAPGSMTGKISGAEAGFIFGKDGAVVISITMEEGEVTVGGDPAGQAH